MFVLALIQIGRLLFIAVNGDETIQLTALFVTIILIGLSFIVSLRATFRTSFFAEPATTTLCTAGLIYFFIDGGQQSMYLGGAAVVLSFISSIWIIEIERELAQLDPIDKDDQVTQKALDTCTNNDECAKYCNKFAKQPRLLICKECEFLHDYLLEAPYRKQQKERD